MDFIINPVRVLWPQ